MSQPENSDSNVGRVIANSEHFGYLTVIFPGYPPSLLPACGFLVTRIDNLHIGRPRTLIQELTKRRVPLLPVINGEFIHDKALALSASVSPRLLKLGAQSPHSSR
ncbi:hypothetical protein ACSFCX_01165 [Yokenella regensburgei]|uniref:hypothetical protein n=1 Tax=Yokenella regensburgei TaxID=158877 RepID=UPI003ED87DBA